MQKLTKINKGSNKVIGLIPARWGSSRFEGKPLVDIAGVPMIKRVYDRACLADKIDEVVVLTDDERIHGYCSKNEMNCLMIEDPCHTGTDRCAKALKFIEGKTFINIQGDEPLINPEAINKLIELHSKQIGVTNAYVRIKEDYKYKDKNVVKVVVNKDNQAMYYSRLPISGYQQMGLYVFSREMLSVFPNLNIGENEFDQKVEMLRFVENGYPVLMVEVEDEGLSVDTPNDVKLVELRIRNEIKKKE